MARKTPVLQQPAAAAPLTKETEEAFVLLLKQALLLALQEQGKLPAWACERAMEALNP